MTVDRVCRHSCVADVIQVGAGIGSSASPSFTLLGGTLGLVLQAPGKCRVLQAGHCAQTCGAFESSMTLILTLACFMYIDAPNAALVWAPTTEGQSWLHAQS